MPKLDENHVNLRKLTPFERALAGHEKNAHLMQIMVETQLLVEGLEKAKDAEREAAAAAREAAAGAKEQLIDAARREAREAAEEAAARSHEESVRVIS